MGTTYSEEAKGLAIANKIHDQKASFCGWGETMVAIVASKFMTPWSAVSMLHGKRNSWSPREDWSDELIEALLEKRGRDPEGILRREGFWRI